VIFSPSMLAFYASEETSFSFISTSCLRSPEISFFMAAFWADSRSNRHNISVFFFYDSCLFYLRHMLCWFYLNFSFCSIVAFHATEVFPLFNKNTSAFWAKFHFKAYLMMFLNVFVWDFIKNMMQFFKGVGWKECIG